MCVKERKVDKKNNKRVDKQLKKLDGMLGYIFGYTEQVYHGETYNEEGGARIVKPEQEVFKVNIEKGVVPMDEQILETKPLSSDQNSGNEKLNEHLIKLSNTYNRSVAEKKSKAQKVKAGAKTKDGREVQKGCLTISDKPSTNASFRSLESLVGKPSFCTTAVQEEVSSYADLFDEYNSLSDENGYFVDLQEEDLQEYSPMLSIENSPKATLTTNTPNIDQLLEELRPTEDELVVNAKNSNNNRLKKIEKFTDPLTIEERKILRSYTKKCEKRRKLSPDIREIVKEKLALEKKERNKRKNKRNKRKI